MYTTKGNIINHISVLRNQINSEKQLIGKVIQARNKIYAHKDPNANVPIVKFKELKSLTELASEIFNELQFRFFFKTTWLEDLNDWNVNYILCCMSEIRKLDDEERKRKIALHKKE